MSVLTQADLEEILAMLDHGPEYHHSGMGCGLEDRNIHNRYEAMQHGWDSAIERVYGEHVNPAIEAIKAAIEKVATPSAQDLSRSWADVVEASAKISEEDRTPRYGPHIRGAIPPAAIRRIGPAYALAEPVFLEFLADKLKPGGLDGIGLDALTGLELVEVIQIPRQPRFMLASPQQHGFHLADLLGRYLPFPDDLAALGRLHLREVGAVGPAVGLILQILPLHHEEIDVGEKDIRHRGTVFLGANSSPCNRVDRERFYKGEFYGVGCPEHACVPHS